MRILKPLCATRLQCDFAPKTQAAAGWGCQPTSFPIKSLTEKDLVLRTICSRPTCLRLPLRPVAARSVAPRLFELHITRIVAWHAGRRV